MNFISGVLCGRRPRSGEDDVTYMVIYGDPQGARELLELDELSAAIELVEQLRNEQAVDDVRLLETNELTFGFKPYYHVELSTQASPVAPATSMPPAPMPEAQPNWSQPADWTTTVDSSNGSLDAVVDSGADSVESDDSLSTGVEEVSEPADVASAVSAGSFSSAELPAVDSSNGSNDDLVWGSSVAQTTEVSEADESDETPQRRGLFGR
jgi:hypothetical protein